jgi:hypothetical protein
MVTQSTKQNDVPIPVAIAFLFVLLGGWIYLKSPTYFGSPWAELDRYADAHWMFIGLVLFSFSINLVWVYSALAKIFGLNRHGKRLDILANHQKKSERGSLFIPWKTISMATFSALILYLWGDFRGLGLIPRAIPVVFANRITLCLSASFGFSIFVLSLTLGKAGGLGFFRRKRRELSEMPLIPNGIVIGAEENPETGEKLWVGMPLPAMNCNLLGTGSIGSGKTSAMILAFLEQILVNFVIRPTILIIDPKSTFIEKVLKLLERLKLQEHVIHMRLEGDVTFNPVYKDRPLKGARFLEIAQMLKAAAANFAASRRDSSFWDISSYNLIRSSITHCASVHGYFTLRDLYSTLVRAGAEDLVGEMQTALKEKQFDEEEGANIKFAIEYFSKEYNNLESKIRTSILATATSFLNQFQEYQASRLFCPTRENLTVTSMDDVIQNGKIFLFDVRNQALARSMGTFIKLHYEQALLDRMALGEEHTKRSAVLVMDEYQDVVTVGGQGAIGDGGFLAKGREGNTITIAATQSLSSLKNAIGNEDAAKELIQNFRTRIACHSSDVATIKNFQEMTGQKETIRHSRSISEQAYHAKRDLIGGGFESKDPSISESLSTTEQKEDVVTGKDFQNLSTFECFALIYDGVKTHFHKLCLKPHFLTKKNTPHEEVLKMMRSKVTLGLLFLAAQSSFSFPNVCSVVKTDEFKSCLNLSVGACMCAGIPPRPCAKIEYYVPQTFIEVMPDPKSSYFGVLPGAAVQLGGVGELPYGQEADEDTQSYQAHVINVPLAEIPFSLLSCGGVRVDKFCFDAMSEHLGQNWNTGSADSLQPQFLAWSLSPKACLLKGAATSFIGGSTGAPHPGSPICSFPMSFLPKYPPSPHEACNGWGTFYPRMGTAHGPSNTIGALMVASRMKSLASEVFNAAPSSPDELWQMISPQSSSCFREGQNIGLLETVKNVRELGRLKTGKLKGHLFVVWSKVSCCRDFAEVPIVYAEVEAMSIACQGLGSGL